MTDKNPWLGLNSYAEHDRLYGRDKETDEVSDIILNNLSTVIYGRSGVGKSSLLRAGVFPRMRYEDFLPVYIRLEHNAAEGYFQQVGRKIKEASADADIQMTADGETVLKERRSGIRKYPLLVFDQFEEIFTLPDNAHKPAVTEFFGHLASLLNNREDSGNAFRVVICLREDYLYFLEQNSSDIPSLKRNRYRLMPLSLSQGREVICRPLPGTVTAETADVILARIDAGGSGYVDPSILSLFMHELYEKGRGSITLENIRLYGGNIITDFYEDGMRSVSVKSAKFLEDRLVTTDGYRHYLSYNDALAAGVTDGELDTLKEKRIITVEKGEKNQRIIELSHDVLCPLVLQSRKERNLKEEADRLAAKTKAMRRRNRVLLLSLSAALLLVAVFVYMFVEIRQQRNGMLIYQSHFVSEKAMELYENDEYIKAMALMTEVYPHNLKNPDRPLTREAYEVLRTIRGSFPAIKKFLHGHASDVTSASCSPDGRHIVTSSDDETAIIWDAETGEQECVLRGHTDRVTSASYSPDGRHIVTSSNDSTAIIWDAETGEQECALRGHTDWLLTSASYSPDGRHIVTSSDDGTAIIWDVGPGKFDGVLVSPGGRNYISVPYSPDSRHLVILAWNTAIIWDAETGEREIILRGHSLLLTSASYSPDGRHIVTSSNDGTAIIWDAETGEQECVLRGHTDRVASASYSPDGRHIVTSSDDSTAIIWDAETGKQECVLRGHDGAVRSAVYSPDGHHIVTSSNDSTAIIWEAETGKQECELRGHDGAVRSAVYSPDGHHILTLSEDSTVIIWDAETGKQECVLRVSYVNSAAYSPDGHHIVTSSGDGTAIIWDAETGKQECVLRHDGAVRSATYSPDGRQIMTLVTNNRVRIWYAPDPQGLIDETLDILNGYRLSPDERRWYYLD